MTGRRPRVLLVTSLPFFQWRGSPIRLGFDIQALVACGFEVDVLTVPIGEGREVDGATIHRVGNPMRFERYPIGPSLPKLVFDLQLLFAAIGMARRYRYDVVHGIEDTGIVAWAAARCCGSRLVFEKHSDPASYKKSWLRNLVMAGYRAVEHWVMRRSDAIIATGEGLAEQARAAAPGRPVHHIFDIPSSLVEPDAKRAAALGARMRQKPDEVLVMYVGSFAVYQGLDLMFDSMPYVVRQHPQARFVIIGGSEPEVEARRTWLRNHGIEDRVTFLGHFPPDELPHYMAAADILLSPRRAGINTPLKLLDYLKAARPIVATNNESNRLILDDSFAMLVEATPPAFAAGINWLIADEDTRLRFGAAGRRLIDERYNFDEYRRRIAAVYADLVKPE